MLKPLLLLCAVVPFVITPTPTPTLAAGGAPQANPVKPTAASQAKAKELYGIDCAICHGETGNGKTDLAKDMNLTLSDWTDPKALAGKSDQELFQNIRKGKGEKMPPEDPGRAKDDQVWNLIIYIREFSKNAPAAAPAPAAPAPAAAPPADAPAPPPAPQANK